MDFREGLAKTVAWYLDNPDWVQGIRTGEYTRWMTEHYPE
jgi:dTDP-glucose 4,6-dehydratase